MKSKNIGLNETSAEKKVQGLRTFLYESASFAFNIAKNQLRYDVSGSSHAAQCW